MTASNRLMWINADRVFYAGLLGSPTLRTLGALSLYVALDAPIRISVAGGVWEEGDVAVVPPYRAHVVASDSRVIANLLIEPETVAVATLPGFMKECAGVVDAPELVQRVGDVHRRFTIGAPKWDRDTSEFDRRFFGGKLAPQPLDRRILAVLDEIKSVPLAPISATQCAASIHLSYSRFLHLFKQEVGVPFRSFRGWKRARSLLHYVTKEANLTDVALNVGYPDSSHFSHSIRQVYGLKPTDIFAGSRKLAVYGS